MRIVLIVLAALAVSGFNQAAEPPFERVLAQAKDLPRLHSLIVSRSGEVVLERYYNGARATRPANVKSVSKSIVSTLVGIAIHRGAIAGVETPIVTWFPELRKDREPAKQAITIEHLLTMQSGLESTSNRNYGAWVQSGNWVQHALRRPLFATPGTAMQYSTGNSHLLSAVLTKATGSSTWRFANDAIGKPLGFTLPQWPQDPQGIFFGGNDMLMTPRQMLAYGEMHLRRGRVGSVQVVPAAWIERSWVPRGRSPISGSEYGYGWWVRDMGGRRTYYAWGFGGQYIFVVPDLDLVVVTTSASTVAEDRRSHRRNVFDLVEQLIVESAAARASGQ
jgi:CubicO group peptidase (beta-lactamase class C family)